MTDGREGLRVLRVLNAAQETLDRGRRTEDGGQKTPRLNTPEGTLVQPQYDKCLRGRQGRDDRGGRTADCFVHETAVVDEDVEVGAGTKIWHFSHVLTNSRIGEKCNIGQNVVIGPDVEIGKGCKIQNNVSVFKGVTLEDGVFCGPSMVFTNIYNPRAEIRKMDQVRPTNCTIICGTNIGRYAFVGAGAVVTRNVQDHALMLGSPARKVGWMCACGERLTDELDCLVCGKRYEEAQEGLKESIGQD